MKKLVIGIFICLGVSIGYLLLSNEQPMKENSTHNKQGQHTEEPSPVTTTLAGGEYVDYSQEVFDNTDGMRLLFFHASWCPQCRTLEQSIQAAQLPEGLTIFKVDYDSSQDLRRKYGVTIQTTVIKVDSNGDLIDKYVAYDDPTYQNVAHNLLD